MSETIIKSGWISTHRAAQLTGYTRDYVGQLARSGRVAAEQVGRTWYVERDSLLRYKAGVRPGRPKEGATDEGGSPLVRRRSAQGLGG